MAYFTNHFFRNLQTAFDDRKIRIFARKDKKTKEVLEVLFSIAPYQMSKEELSAFFDFFKDYKSPIAALVETYNDELIEGKKKLEPIEKQITEYLLYSIDERDKFYDYALHHEHYFYPLYLNPNE